MTRFVILAVPRTGSNLLCTLLNSHPQILCHHEIFNPQGVFVALDYHGQELAVESLQHRDDDPLGFLDCVWQTGKDHTCVGFKWTRGQNQEVLSRVLKDPRVNKLILRRRNRIKTYVSEMIAQETQQWEAYSRHDLTMPRPRVEVDVGQLLEHIATNRLFYAEVMTDLECPYLEIDFESLFEPVVQQHMLEFLDVTVDLPLTEASVKQNSTDLRDAISNFAELAACLPNDELVNELHDRGI